MKKFVVLYMASGPEFEKMMKLPSSATWRTILEHCS
jgi:hypothetical protein